MLVLIISRAISRENRIYSTVEGYAHSLQPATCQLQICIVHCTILQPTAAHCLLDCALKNYLQGRAMAKSFAFGLVAVALGRAAAFAPSTSHTQIRNPSLLISSPSNGIQNSPAQIGRSTPTSLQMCICINCSRVTNCQAYHFVEQQHSQPHVNKIPTWEPRNGSPTIQVHIRPDADKKTTNELDKMWEEHEDQTRQAEAASNDDGDEPLVGETQYDLSGATSYEYDVIECEDYDEDMGTWVRNMPEEIRLANPDFVPT